MDKDDLKRFDELTDDCIKKHKAFVEISKRALRWMATKIALQ
jgi:hypothetical protein